jgi:hypothetical protein
MSNFRLNLPVDIPWKLLDVSRDMMDPTFCNKKSPPPFRSSIAVFGYEPSLDELPEEMSMCGDRITYLKITCSITGYQPALEEKDKLIVDLNLVDSAEITLERVLEPYFACYAALINVAVFPFDAQERNVDAFPHIVDFEPKVRDFYQIASETGEILSGSVNRLAVGKSYMFADSTEDTVSMTNTTTDGNSSSEGMATLKNTTSDQASFSINSDFSREERETHSTTTQLTQMYNLLSSYHIGTNRATFLLLPRPHVLQPTNRRTFVDGLRMIEGVQDFFLVVARKKNGQGLRVDVNLSTGHFPEDVSEVLVAKPSAAAEQEREIELTFRTDGKQTRQHLSDHQYEIGVDEGWEIDESAYPHGAHRFFHSTFNLKPTDITNHVWDAVKELPVGSTIHHNVLTARYTVKSTENGVGTISDKYRVKLKKKPVPPSTKADRDYLLITARTLCTIIESKNKCLRKLPGPNIGERPDYGIVDESDFDFTIPDPFKDSRGPDVGPFYRRVTNAIKNTMMRSSTSTNKYPPGEVGYLQSRYFHSRICNVLGKDHVARKLSTFKAKLPNVMKKLDPDLTLQQFLKMDIHALSRKLSLSLSQTAQLRARVLGVRDRKVASDENQDKSQGSRRKPRRPASRKDIRRSKTRPTSYKASFSRSRTPSPLRKRVSR